MVLIDGFNLAASVVKKHVSLLRLHQNNYCPFTSLQYTSRKRVHH